jgi:16S rRNA (guanine527-N7)-methyltransferase
LPKGTTLADIGCGAGFPTLPVAILRPDVKITGIDSTAKRVAYVNSAAQQLGCDNVTAIAGRAEELARTNLRESFDFATARAVAAMRVLAELSLPFVKLGGSLIAMKGKNAATELSESKRAITTLGGKLDEVREITLVGTDEELSHPLVFVKKVSKTAPQYPRQFSQISKKPL